MGDHILLDLEEWALVLSKMLRFHFNVSEDIKKIVQTIRVEMKPELIPLAEEKVKLWQGAEESHQVTFIGLQG